MNLYGVIVLAALVGDYVLDLVANLLNLRALRKELPAEFRDVYDAAVYRRSQEYTRAATRLGLVSSSFDLALVLGFWFAGGFNRLDLWLRGFGLGELWTGLLYIGALVLAKGVLELPFKIYATFVLEERFGFNRTTARTFVGDLVKGLGLAVVLGGPFVAGVLYFFDRVGDNAWIYCWIASALFVLALQVVFPTWILPLFNKFEPLAAGELRQALEAYAKTVGFALSGVFVVDGSRRSSRANAFFAGLGRNRRVALFDTLIEKHSVPELVAVLAHEIGHYKKRHVLTAIVVSLANLGLTFYLLSIFLEHPGLFAAFFVDNPSVYVGLVIFGLLYAPIDHVLSLLLQVLLRRHEYEADRFAVDTVAEPAAMVSALKKLAADNLSNLTPHPLYVFLNYSHPPLTERLRAIRRRLAALPV